MLHCSCCEFKAVAKFTQTTNPARIMKVSRHVLVMLSHKYF